MLDQLARELTANLASRGEGGGRAWWRLLGVQAPLHAARAVESNVSRRLAHQAPPFILPPSATLHSALCSLGRRPCRLHGGGAQQLPGAFPDTPAGQDVLPGHGGAVSVDGCLSK